MASHREVLRIGLTGGIGTGKSTVCQMFAARGVPIIDTDLIAREVVAPGSAGLASVAALFGDTVLTGDGQLDRAQLRQRVFQESGARERLEALLHPLIRERMRGQVAAVGEAPYCILAIPLLVEKGWQDEVDRILVVDAPRELQLQRASARDRLPRAQVEAIIATQASRETRLAAADDILLNTGSLANLERQVVALHHRYTRLGRGGNIGN